jgi:hypothetical protein
LHFLLQAGNGRVLRRLKQLILYQTEDGETRIQVTMQDETVWLTQKQMAELFQRDKFVISRHINNVFKESELERGATVAKIATVQQVSYPCLPCRFKAELCYMMTLLKKGRFDQKTRFL